MSVLKSIAQRLANPNRSASRDYLRRHATTVAAISVAWTLSWPGVAGAIVGARSAEQVDGWIRAGEIELTRQDLDEQAAGPRVRDPCRPPPISN
jgi:aryl-alcohol dehydrogenase-like predicted oxidoreductase